MGKQEIRNFPQEVSGGAWPLLQPTLEDKQYQPIAESEAMRAQRLQQENGHQFYSDIPVTLFKGTILGLLCFSVFFGVIQNLSFWLQEWRWAVAIIGTILLGILIGPNRTLTVLALAVVIIGIITIVVSPPLILWLLFFIIGGMLARVTFELLP